MTSSGSARGANWKPGEDRVLSQAWLSATENPRVGTDQTSDEFWSTIAATYDSTRPRRELKFARSQNACMKRWKIIQAAVSKFCGCLNAVKQLNQSGKTIEDTIQDAHTMFEERYGKEFLFVDFWRVVREAPKWKEMDATRANRRVAGKRRAAEAMYNLEEYPEQTTISAMSVEDSANMKVAQRERPLGKKKAKKIDSIEETFRKFVDYSQDHMNRREELKAEASREREERNARKETDRLFFMPTAHLDEQAKRYLELRKKDVLERMEMARAERTSCTSSTDPGSETAHYNADTDCRNETKVEQRETSST
jgi:hypothetical protein